MREKGSVIRVEWRCNTLVWLQATGSRFLPNRFLTEYYTQLSVPRARSRLTLPLVHSDRH